MLHAPDTLCGGAVKIPVIHADRSEDQILKSHVADCAAVRNFHASGKLSTRRYGRLVTCMTIQGTFIAAILIIRLSAPADRLFSDENAASGRDI